MAPKKSFLDFLKMFVMLVFLGNNLKWKLTFLLIFHYHIWQSSGYQVMGQKAINLQDFLICIILRKKWIMKFVFCMQINIEVFYKVILPFWVSVTRHAQSTQSKFAYIYNISIKAWGMKLIFCLQINIKVLNKMIVSLMMYVGRHAQTTQNNRFTIPLQ